jgi:glycosyltransferase involved in cell wall biosynthesis
VANRRVEFIVPTGIDDPRRPSGGNVYGRRLSDELPAVGWTVHEHPTDLDGLADILVSLPDEAIVLVDGLIASAATDLVQAAGRLRVIVLVHMPFAEADRAIGPVEAAVLTAAAGVITTSAWSRDWVVEHHGVAAERIRVAEPGVDTAPPHVPSESGGNLMCVGPVTRAKGQDVLVNALSDLAELDWHCTFVGALDLDREFVASIQASADLAGIAARLEFTGPLTRPALATVRARTDLTVSASRRESYGMVVAEALAAGIPIIATDVGGQSEAIGPASDDSLPGRLLPAGDTSALADALRTWLTDAAVRDQWRRSAGLRRADLPDWSHTAERVAGALDSFVTEPGSGATPI